VLVQSAIHDAFLAALAKRVAGLRVGHGTADGTTFGPLINRAGVAKVARHVTDALGKGATLVTGGGALAGSGGHFFAPTVLTGCGPGMLCFDEETFGPVVSVVKFGTEAEAVALANKSSVGLAGYLCTADLGRAWRVAGDLEVGMVGINEGAISTEVAPFGGIKMSGLGREGGAVGMDEYLNTKYICMGGLAE